MYAEEGAFVPQKRYMYHTTSIQVEVPFPDTCGCKAIDMPDDRMGFL